MKENKPNFQIVRASLYCTWVVGVAYILVVLCAFLSPAPVASYVASTEYFADFKGYEGYFIFLKCMMLIASGGMVGVVIGLYQLRPRQYDSWLPLFSLLAIIGLGIGMFQSIVDATQVPHLAKEYADSSEEVQHVIIAFGVANPAIYALSLGLPGLWFLVVSFCFRRAFSKTLILLSALWGLGSVSTIVAHMLVIVAFIYLIATGAFIVMPFWIFFQAKYLRSVLKLQK